jgi:uncharacterized protein
MIVLAFGDLHSDFKTLKIVIKKAKKADFIICCGDLSFFGRRYNELLRILNKIGKTVYIIKGNHDPASNIKLKNIINIHKKVFKIGEKYLAGYSDQGFAMESKDLEKFFMKHKDKLKNGLMITHGPPYKTKLDDLEEGHVGSKSTRKVIEKIKPMVHISGHLHEHFDEMDLIKEALIINPGPDGSLLEI